MQVWSYSKLKEYKTLKILQNEIMTKHCSTELFEVICIFFSYLNRFLSSLVSDKSLFSYPSCKSYSWRSHFYGCCI